MYYLNTCTVLTALFLQDHNHDSHHLSHTFHKMFFSLFAHKIHLINQTNSDVTYASQVNVMSPAPHRTMTFTLPSVVAPYAYLQTWSLYQMFRMAKVIEWVSAILEFL